MKEKVERALAALEQEATKPVVPGEFLSWFRPVEEAGRALRQVWSEAQDQWTEEARRIVEEDPGLAPRADRLRRRSEELGSRLGELFGRARDLRASDLEDPTGSREELPAERSWREELLAWIVSARAHDAEVRTWLVESLYRDRGVGD